MSAQRWQGDANSKQAVVTVGEGDIVEAPADAVVDEEAIFIAVVGAHSKELRPAVWSEGRRHAGAAGAAFRHVRAHVFWSSTV